VYVLDGIVTANGEVGISGSRSSPCENKTIFPAKQVVARDNSRFHPVHVVYHFKFQISNFQASVLGGRAIGGGRIRAQVGLPDRYLGTRQRKTGDMSRKIQTRRHERPIFFVLVCLRPPTCPRGDGGPRQEECRVGRSGNDLGAGSTGCDGGIDE
jgi:hypothetical protein